MFCKTSTLEKHKSAIMNRIDSLELMMVSYMEDILDKLNDLNEGNIIMSDELNLLTTAVDHEAALVAEAIALLKTDAAALAAAAAAPVIDPVAVAALTAKLNASADALAVVLPAPVVVAPVVAAPVVEPVVAPAV